MKMKERDIKFSQFKIFVLSFLILFSINHYSMFSQYNLEYYLNSAYANNPNVKELNNTIRINELNKDIVYAQYSIPHASISADYLFAPYFNNNGQLLSTNPSPQAYGYDVSKTNGGLYSAQFNIEKNIFNSGLIDVFYNQSDLQSGSNRNQIELIRHGINKEVTAQYLSCLRSHELYLISDNIADTLKKQLTITDSMVSKGYAKQSDYLLLKVEFETQSITAEQYLNEYRSNLFTLNSLCGIHDSSVVNLSEIKLEESVKNIHSNFLMQYTIDSSLAINSQEIFETQYLPQVNLFFNAGLNAVELNQMQRKFGFNAGVNFLLPIYDGSQRSITRQQSQINLSTINAYRENEMIVLNNKISDAKAQVDFFRGNLSKIKEQLANYEKVIDISKAELIKGQLFMIEYITIIKNYLELKKNEITTSFDYQQAINNYNYWNW
jgi:outer membrane protein TolC